MTDRLCLLCGNYLAEQNPDDFCYRHSVFEIKEFRKKQRELGRKEPEEERSMKSRMGTCSNCKREGMPIRTLYGHKDLCATCGGSLLRVQAENHEAVLVACREKLMGKGRLRSPRAVRPVPPKEDTVASSPRPTAAVITAPKPESGEEQGPARVENFGLPCVIRVFVGSQEILSVAGRIEIEAI